MRRPLQPEILVAMTRWRKDLHAHPELAFDEHRTAELVARELNAMAIDVHRGLGGTGIVGSITNGAGPSIGIRADMDALPIQELNSVSHSSTRSGVMHACGHDGHVAMLLGAARHLSEYRLFQGTVHFIFQPAEEGEGGGKAMVEDGLFDRFPCNAVYAMHNWPGLAAGEFVVNRGPMMAALDTFEITIHGRGSHAAMPERGVDPFPAVAQIVLGLQTIPSRMLSALDAAVVSVTQILGGSALNVIPGHVVIRGTARCLEPATQDRVESALRSMATSLASAHGAAASVDYQRRYPPTINNVAEAEKAIAAACHVVGASRVHVGVPPSMASEDFSFMLQARPGAYLWFGADGAKPSAALHNPHYDFNDETLGIGASYWVTLVEMLLGEPESLVTVANQPA